jgi:dCMP deaminase
MQTLCAYGVKQVYYRDIYQQSDAPEIADTYGILLAQVEEFPQYP